MDGWMDMYNHVFLTSTLIGGDGQLHVLTTLPLEIGPQYLLIKGWVVPRAGLDDIDK
jgi:hypothetical protein